MTKKQKEKFFLSTDHDIHKACLNLGIEEFKNHLHRLNTFTKIRNSPVKTNQYKKSKFFLADQADDSLQKSKQNCLPQVDFFQCQSLKRNSSQPLMTKKCITQDFEKTKKQPKLSINAELKRNQTFQYQPSQLNALEKISKLKSLFPHKKHSFSLNKQKSKLYSEQFDTSTLIASMKNITPLKKCRIHTQTTDPIKYYDLKFDSSSKNLSTASSKLTASSYNKDTLLPLKYFADKIKTKIKQNNTYRLLQSKRVKTSSNMIPTQVTLQEII